MSNSFKNPLTPLIAEPVNIDRPIQELQQALAELPWLEKSFGRSFVACKKDADGKNTIVYPQVWQGVGLDFLNVMPNDNLKSQSFFKVEDPIEFTEYVRDGQSMMRANVSVIFWFQYLRINPDADHAFIELLKAQAQKTISTAILSSQSSVEIARIWEGAENVFRGYTIDKMANQELIWPFGGFRFEMLIDFMENCSDYVPPFPSGTTWDNAHVLWNSN